MAHNERGALFSRARQAFAGRGLLRRSLRLSLGGRLYSVRCDDECFSLYRVNDKPFMPPGLPGWMVCRLSDGECFSLDQDEKACPLGQSPEQVEQARAWLEQVLASLPPDES